MLGDSWKVRRNSLTRDEAMQSQSQGLSEQQLRDLRQIFDWLDFSGDGEVDSPELLTVLRTTSSSATLEQARELIREATGGAKDTVNWLEFVRVIEKGLQKGKDTTAAQMFELLDVSHSGQLSPEVLRAGLKQWGCDTSDHAIDKMIRYSTRAHVHR